MECKASCSWSYTWTIPKMITWKVFFAWKIMCKLLSPLIWCYILIVMSGLMSKYLRRKSFGYNFIYVHHINIKNRSLVTIPFISGVQYPHRSGHVTRFNPLLLNTKDEQALVWHEFTSKKIVLSAMYYLGLWWSITLKNCWIFGVDLTRFLFSNVFIGQIIQIKEILSV